MSIKARMGGPSRLGDWTRRHPWLAALCGAGASICALLLRFCVDRIMPPGLPYLTFFPAVVLVTFFLGARPGIVCAILSGVSAWYFFIPPYQTFAIDLPIAVALAFYVFVVTVDIVLIHTLQRNALEVDRSRAVVEELSATLEQQVAERTDELRKVATLQTAILDHAGYAIIATDAAGTITLFNPAAERMLGHAASELIGRADPSLFHDPVELALHAEHVSTEIGRRVEAGFEALAANVPEAGAQLREWTFRTKLGRRFPVLLNISRLKAEDGSGIGFLKIVGDLTQQHRHEAELKAAGAGTWKVDIRTGRVWCSAETARQHDLPEQPIELDIERDWRPIAHPDDAPRAIADLEAAIAARGPFASDFRVRCRDGSTRWITTLGEVESNAQGEAVRVVGLSLDTTARKEAELALRQSEERYRMLAESTVDMIAQTDIDGVRRYVSPGCRKIVGYEPEELVGRASHEIVHPEDLASVEALVADLVAGRRSEAVLGQRYRRKDGSFVWVEVSYGLVREADGAAVACLLCARDVSERHAHAEALQQAKLAAERASHAKTDFLAAMSHEIRTPLHAIIGFTDLMLASGRLDPESARRAGHVQVSGKALLTVVNDILDFSKVEAGALDLVLEPFSPRALVEGCIEIIRGLAAPKQLEVAAIIDAELPAALVGDQSRLRQILLNLLNNAVKFTPEGSVTLRVANAGASDAGRRFRFEVVDTGIGIPPDENARLFERFYQVAGSIRRDFGGSGLGLAICKRLVELMGGEIGLVSEVGTGSTFWFEVVLAPAILSPDRSPVPAVVEAHRSGRVLVVEDVDVSQELAKALLEGAGHEVDVAGDGVAALQAIDAKAYDLILMDVQMPGMDGLTATQLIRQSASANARTPIIALTANVLPDQLAAFGAVGIDGHIGKPFDYEEFYAVVDDWLGGRARLEEGAAVAGAAAAVGRRLTA